MLRKQVRYVINLLAVLGMFFMIPVIMGGCASVLQGQGSSTAPVSTAPSSVSANPEFKDILVPNESEAKVLLGLDPQAPLEAEPLALSLLERTGAGCVMVTLGERGVVAAAAGQTWQISPPPVQAVDTSGAGDVFCAALAVGLVEGHSLKMAAEWACAVAALSVSRAGTIPAFPTRDEVNQFLTP